MPESRDKPPDIKRRRRPAAPLAAACLAAALAAPILEASGAGPLAFDRARAGEAAKIFHGLGTVTAVDPAAGSITVDHGAIPGFMDAMEMAYKVRPAALAAGLQAGDTIAFGVDGKAMTIVEIRKVAKR